MFIKTLLICLFFICNSLYSELIVRLESYDYADQHGRDHYFEGIRIFTSEILLSDVDSDASEGRLSERISIVALPYEGIISVIAHDPADRAIERAVVSEFMQRTKSVRLRAQMLARDRIMPKLEELRKRVHALDNTGPNFEAARKEYMGLLEKLRDMTSYDDSSSDYTWRVYEDKKD